MWMGVITAVVLAAVIAAAYVVRSTEKAEMQKYYDAAYKMIKENCLNNAIRNQSAPSYGGQKTMVYLKWKDEQKQGFVFDPDQGIRIGRSPGENEICIRDGAVSGRHCVIFLSQGRLAVKDLHSANGTWIIRGLKRRAVDMAEYLLTGDRLVVGTLKIKVTIFTFDMAYL
ncbi:MAG: FHA domain-containing protein [Faecalicatena sp.]|uniref:FHA domain-containing protein n=1 Tax=Faecalicatena sp. TaxID=2005360 RepID=UPI002588908C|nr:FHA domain-containing protein [Faecalicatena sp.]MCI6464645.1 FHA domain-containing protein [Faecalicatena sp.]MDY5618223.1 FHA domain-containing protein [Lachnospiraceae bacterium]